MSGERLPINMPGGGEGRMPAAFCDLCSTMGALRHKVFGRDTIMAGLLTARQEELAGIPGHASYVCDRVRVCPLQVGRDGSASGSRGLAFRTT